jgi:amino acid transporter
MENEEKKIVDSENVEEKPEKAVKEEPKSEPVEEPKVEKTPKPKGKRMTFKEFLGLPAVLVLVLLTYAFYNAIQMIEWLDAVSGFDGVDRAPAILLLINDIFILGAVITHLIFFILRIAGVRPISKTGIILEVILFGSTALLLFISWIMKLVDGNAVTALQFIGIFAALITMGVISYIHTGWLCQLKNK